MKIIVNSSPRQWDKIKKGEYDYTLRTLDEEDTLEIVHRETGEILRKKITSILTLGKEITITFN